MPIELPPFVDAPWLAAHREEVVCCDVRWYLDGRSGLEAYVSGHLPGARFVDLESVLAEPPSGVAGRHPLASPARFARGLGALGIEEAQPVVAYDDAGGTVAARLVWMLRSLGEPAAVLEGGLAAWPGPREEGMAVVRPCRRPARPWPKEMLAGLEEVATLASGTGAASREPKVRLVDVRAPARYRGEEEPVDPRAGHVPGALSVPYHVVLDPDTGALADTESVLSAAAQVGLRPGDEVIAYCGSGVTACFGLLALERAGLGRGRLWPGSWSQWSARPELEVVVGARPGGRA